MKKFLIASYVAFQASTTFAREIYSTWEVEGNNFTLTKEPYNEEKATIYNRICKEFHRHDRKGTEEICKHLGTTEEDYWEWVDGFMQKRSTELSEGIVSLLLITKNETEIVGGTYYLNEQEDKAVRIGGMGFKLDLTKEESRQSKIQTMSILTSKTYFPEAERVVVLLWKNSELISQVTELEFTGSSYNIKVENVPPDSYLFFEKKIGE